MRSMLLALSLVLGGLLWTSPSTAQTRLVIPCPNGPACWTQVWGHIDAVGTARLPWVVSVAVPQGVCFYVENKSSDGPLINTAIAPDGAVYRGNILINPTKAGWYTIQLDSPPPGIEQIFEVEIGFHNPRDFRCLGL